MSTQTSLNDVTIGSLAKASGLSKSGLFSHFKSKENLQVAVIEHASQLFVERVILPAQSIEAPLERLKKLASNWLNWYDGCARSCIFIIATVEFDDQPGEVRDAIRSQLERWINYLDLTVDAAIAAGEFKADLDRKQFAYQVYSLYLGSQMFYWLNREDKQRSRFHRAFEELIEQNRT